MTPLAQACSAGDVAACIWLYTSQGAAEDISKADNDGTTPMLLACEGGHLSVCEWLYEMGATADICRVNNKGWTPMLLACWRGHLSVCKWLFKVGADGDVSRADNVSTTPMYWACRQGHLSVCEWLFEVGADITRADNFGNTPMIWACRNGHRLPLLTWAKRIIATHHNFLHLVLRASVIVPASQLHVAVANRCLLPRLFRTDHVIMRRVWAFVVGVKTAQQLRMREFAEALEHSAQA